MRRRSWFGSTSVTSSPSRMIRPPVGSMMRLIIFIVVVLPQPDGPTSTTISPRGMSIDTRSTAGFSWPGKRLVSSWSWIIRSVTDASWDGQTADGEVQKVEEHRQHDDDDGSAEQGLEGSRRRDAADAGEDLVAEAGASDQRGDGCDADGEQCGDADPGEDHGPRVGEFDL